jgi:CHAT domain-containing protein
VSLWDVADRSTSDLMYELYRGMIEGEPPAAALRQAKLSFLRSDRPARRQIRNWAPFVLVGDPGEPTKDMNHGREQPTSEE